MLNELHPNKVILGRLEYDISKSQSTMLNDLHPNNVILGAFTV